jgi:hypothetical protein
MIGKGWPKLTFPWLCIPSTERRDGEPVKLLTPRRPVKVSWGGKDARRARLGGHFYWLARNDVLSKPVGQLLDGQLARGECEKRRDQFDVAAS